MAELGESFGENGVGEELAVDDDPVEIEDDRLEPNRSPGPMLTRFEAIPETQRLSPNRAVPTRTCVAPVMTAVS